MPGIVMKPLFPVTEHAVVTPRHKSFFLACGAPEAPPIIFLHGWPELSLSWRHQLPVFASLGFRAIAPDMRGYGRSSVYERHEDYALEVIVQDMLELLAAIGSDRAIWVGHDWGSPVVWSLASHHPDRCQAIASLCVPYLPGGFCPPSFLPLVDRTVYPEAEYPAGQWDYQLFYEENFDTARRHFEADVASTIKALFRKGSAAAKGKPTRTSDVRRRGGWFAPLDRAPPVPLDADVISEEDLAVYVSGLERNGFFGPDSWYMNHRRNAEYAQRAPNGGRLAMPVLFLHGAYDYVCETTTSRLAEPMRASCNDLTEVVVPSGHWMAQERPVEVNAALARWLATRVADAWPSTKF
jgi:pimeloyl-ACP methyl ester carboxylesterase